MKRCIKKIPYKESWNDYGRWLCRNLRKGTIGIVGISVGIDLRDEIFLLPRFP
ncbi:MAG: hypothetical protein ACFFAN_04280 [Promethearchaeota archaeon]